MDSRRQRRRGAGGRGADRTAARAQSAHPADLGHGDVGRDRRQAVSRRRDPSIRAVQFAALRRALPRSLAAVAGAVHRIRPVAEPDPVERGAAAADGADQRPDVATLVSALAPGLRHHLGAARPLRGLPRAIRTRRRAVRSARQPQRHGHRKSQARRAGAAGRYRQARTADVDDAGPAGRGRGLDPSRRGRDPGRDPQDAGRILSGVVDRDRAAACRSRRGDRRA